MRRFDAVLFDLDGTLIHSSPGIFDGLAWAARQFGVSVEGRDLTPFLGPPLRHIFETLLPDPALAPRAVEMYRQRYQEVGRYMCEPYPFVPALLRTLKDRGVLLATATCKLNTLAEEILQEKGLLPFFDFVGGSLADGSVETKEEVIRTVLAQPAFDTACQKGRLLMVGDRADDLRGARACGVLAAGVLYGYGSRQELAEQRPAWLVKDAKELLACVWEPQNALY